MFFDTGGFEQVRSFRRQHQVIDANAIVFLPGARLIIPECIDVAAYR